MAKSPGPPRKIISKGKKAKPVVYNPGPGIQQSTVFERANKWLLNKEKPILFILFGACLLFCLLLFQARMDIGGDDSAYILRGYDFIHKGVFPSYQGPLYPIVLSLFIAVFGVKVLGLKMLSVVFILGALFVSYKAFKKHFPPLIFFAVMFLTAINAYIDNFASLTYSEALAMLLQACLILYFYKLIEKLETEGGTALKNTYKNWLLVGLFIVLLSLARNIGFIAMVGFMAYFAIRKQYKYIAYLLAAVMVFQLPEMLMEKAIWHVSNQWGGQSAQHMLKNPYDPSKGNETFSGYIVRFFGNCNIYFSKRFLQIIGLRSADAITSSPGVTFLFILTGIFACFRVFKSKNFYLMATVLYVGAMVCGTFFGLQVQWDQPRIIMVFVPLLMFIFLFAFYDVLKKRSGFMQKLFIYAIIGLVIAGMASSVNASAKNSKILDKNIKGDIFYGYTNDWVNYLRMSQWCADNLPKDAHIAARKAPMSFIYTGKEFFPIYKAYYTNADSVLNFFQKNKVDYVILASLRINPNVDNGGIINTLWQMLAPVAKKYPNKLKLIHQEGATEPAYLYQIVQ